MTQIALAAVPALRRLTGQLVSRLALAVLLAYLAAVAPSVAHSTWEHGPLEGVQTMGTLTYWLVSGFWQAIAG